MEIEFNTELDLEAFIADIESEASQSAYDQRHIHPPVSLAGKHNSDPAPMDPQLLPDLEDDLPLVSDAWE